MADTVDFVIGGESIAVGPITLYTLRRCWDGPLERLSQQEVGSQLAATLAREGREATAEEKSAAAKDQMERASAVLNLLATCLTCEGRETTADALERRVRLNEWPLLNVGLVALFALSGLGRGAVEPGEAGASSTATGNESSPSSPTTA